MYEGTTSRHVAPEYVEELQDILARLDRSAGPEGMNLRAFRLNALCGELKGHYDLSVSCN